MDFARPSAPSAPHVFPPREALSPPPLLLPHSQQGTPPPAPRYLVAPLQLAHGLRDQFPPSKFLPALQRLADAHDALGDGPNWLQPKGVGVVCVAENGMPKDSFVHFYFGKM